MEGSSNDITECLPGDKPSMGMFILLYTPLSFNTGFSRLLEIP